MDRLSLSTYDSLPRAVRPALDPRDIHVGIVHLGLGAFHRAHQAAYTQAAMEASGDLSWGICGVTQRSATVVDRLRPQDGLYSVVERGDRTSARVLVPLRGLLFAQADSAELTSRIAAPQTRLVTVTVSEKGYRLDPLSRRLKSADPEITADAAGRPPQTVVGQIVRGLQARRRAGSGPITVVCCDNLARNGATLAGLVEDFCSLLPAQERPDLQWIADNVRFPSTMVDRIVPATTPADLHEAAMLLGVEDHAAVVAEPFSQWVIEDSFAAERPAWERAGAIFTVDVAPYEAMKLRLLNGAHSALAYLGVLAGFDDVAEFVGSGDVATYLRALMDADVSPTLTVPDGFDLAEYKTTLIRRFGNGALGYRTTQIATDGTQKLPQRLLGTIADRRRAGAQPRLATLAVAGWMRYLSAGRDEAGRPIVVDDPLAAEIAMRLAGARTSAQVVEALLGIEAVFAAELRDDADFRATLIDLLESLARKGALATLHETVA